MLLLTVLNIINFVFADITDYTRENYVLIENRDTLIYEQYGDILHVSNLTYYRDILREEKQFFEKEKAKHTYDHSEFLEIDMEIDLTETLLSQIDISRNKRGINELGTIWKWITGTPDHDDFTYITNKINDLITNNNKQYATNSELFSIIKKLSNTVNTLTGHAYERIVRRHRLKLVINDLQNTIQTISLAKASILNPTILHYKEIQEILQHEYKQVHITDLLDSSKFKIVQKDSLIILFIQYPLIYDKCNLFESKAIAQADGKLIIPKEAIKCNNTYFNVENCKIELSDTYCKIKRDENCFINILNNKPATCKKLKQNNTEIEIIKDGAILISGNHTVDNINLSGTYLITFNETVKINNITYENPTRKLYLYLKHHNYHNFEIVEYIETKNEEIEFENRNLLNNINNEYTNSPITSNFLIITIIILIIYLAYKLHKHCKIKKEKRHAKNQEKLFIELNENITNLMTRDDSS